MIILSTKTAVTKPRGRAGGSGTEILTTEGLHMTINWLIVKNENCVALRRSTKYQTCSNLYFFDYSLMVGSARKALVVLGVGRNTCFQQYGDDLAYSLFFSTCQNETVKEAPPADF